ncbi:MAG: hypothetical protein WBC91_06240 [Phototrophicaceae bacterium]
MPYLRIRQNWQLIVKEPHTVHLDVREGFINDTIELYVDEDLVATAKAGLVGASGYQLFDIDGRTHELRWVWSLMSGNPVSIVIMHKDRILAQYGSDRAAQDDLIQD